MSERSADCVKVVMRCRPLSGSETIRKCTSVVDIDPKSNQVKLSQPGDGETRTFTFDECFDAASLQYNVYERTAKPIVEGVLEGYNGTIFCYGQTGAGKTFTMDGEDDALPASESKRGLMPNVFSHVFELIKAEMQSESGANKGFLLRASYLELYNEQVMDLMATGEGVTKHLDVKENSGGGVYVKDLMWTTVANPSEIDKVRRKGRMNRHTGATLMNAESSRSHSIFSIIVEGSETLPGSKETRYWMGKLNLVDLAGSERQAKTQATGDRLKEATKINLSLSSLGNVISSLVDGKTHIPYRDSKLTRLLQDSLGGNTKTVMVANVSPADFNHDETLSTLRYADRAKRIKNKPKINEDPKDTMLRELQEEIQRLKSQVGGNKRGSQNLSSEQLAAAMKEIENEKAAMMSQMNQTAEERAKISHELERRQKELQAEREERENLAAKLQELEKNIVTSTSSFGQEEELMMEWEAILQEEEERNMVLSQKLDEARAERDTYFEHMQEARTEADGHKKQLAESKVQLAAAETKVQALMEGQEAQQTYGVQKASHEKKSAEASHQREVAEWERRFKEAERARGQVENDLEEMMTARASAEGEAESLRHQLEQSQASQDQADEQLKKALTKLDEQEMFGDVAREEILRLQLNTQQQAEWFTAEHAELTEETRKGVALSPDERRRPSEFEREAGIARVLQSNDLVAVKKALLDTKRELFSYSKLDGELAEKNKLIETLREKDRKQKEEMQHLRKVLREKGEETTRAKLMQRQLEGKVAALHKNLDEQITENNEKVNELTLALETLGSLSREIDRMEGKVPEGDEDGGGGDGTPRLAELQNAVHSAAELGANLKRKNELMTEQRTELKAVEEKLKVNEQVNEQTKSEVKDTTKEVWQDIVNKSRSILMNGNFAKECENMMIDESSDVPVMMKNLRENLGGFMEELVDQTDNLLMQLAEAKAHNANLRVQVMSLNESVAELALAQTPTTQGSWLSNMFGGKRGSVNGTDGPTPERRRSSLSFDTPPTTPAIDADV